MQVPATTPARQTWWVLAVGGAASILFGVAALLWPGLTLFILVWLFGAYAIVNGIAELIGMFGAIGQHRTWWTHLLLGLLSIAAGVFVFAYPGITALTLLYVLAFWAITIGVVEVVAAFTTGQFILVVTGVISILFGFILLSTPVPGALAYVMVIGVFAIVRGVLLIVQAVRAPAAPMT